MIRHLNRRRGEKGFTLAELVMVAALIAVLSTMALPVAKFTVKRRKEAELRLALRLMRNAIDEHKRLSDQGLIPLILAARLRRTLRCWWRASIWWGRRPSAASSVGSVIR
jgi:prepilin-type N-terminal cleavage/methylation domain-containing protein